ncbi:porin, partial [Pararhodospirillum oryzae]|uniref:porin n=1 Tax=Pararhodospirillum oryzae TaxID=478448 RepID=UPI0011BF8EB3
SAMIQFEAEANENGNRNVDEQYVDVSGAFGKLRMGEKSGIFESFAVRAPDVGEVSPDDTVSVWLNQNTGMNLTTGSMDTTYDDDSLRVSYVTPSFYGFSAGVSYAPKPSGNLADRRGAGVPTGDSFRDEVQFGMALDTELAGVGVKADGVAMTEAADNDSWAYRGGLELSYAGFAVGGSYMGNEGKDFRDASVWEAGASYTTGPYAVSFTYAESDALDDGTSYKLAGAYEMGPGVKVVGNVFYANIDEDSTGNYRSGMGAVTGLVLSF